jgi:hypothetical protein
MFKLKEAIQGFTVIDGPMAGKSFKQGIIYPEIPPQEKAKFEKVAEEDAPADAAETGGKQKKATK